MLMIYCLCLILNFLHISWAYIMFGWKSASFDNYKEAYALYGGGISTSPEVLQFLHCRFDFKEKFFVREDHEGKILSALCVWDSRYLAGEPGIYQKVGAPYPICSDEIIFPSKDNIKFILPFKSKHLSHKNSKSAINSSHAINAHREICVVKKFSSKTINTRNRELKKFLGSDGSLLNICDISTDEFVDIYDELYFMRRQVHINKKATKELLDEIPSLKFGHILMWKKQPAVVQFVLKKECVNWVNFDFVNTGRDMNLKDASIGTVAMWVNVRNALVLAEEKGVAMRFSFGRPTFDYKDRWCHREKLYKVITF
ncbi:conserved hypothetical protein [Xenorhabdus szentirmaii DSM 16338]|uniref:Mig-14 family protein n=2 Tax=Xenorhabdus szentirmaii TaxID=290112 RepID=W1ITU7_9GAMM|nr:Mig-14 [Xenorhabdus szentirmaii DSM 16338]CDL81869.1 conserved hypothetical protein [Xenorhabdus szentirmaii DSM 16338]